MQEIDPALTVLCVNCNNFIEVDIIEKHSSTCVFYQSGIQILEDSNEHIFIQFQLQKLLECLEKQKCNLSSIAAQIKNLNFGQDYKKQMKNLLQMLYIEYGPRNLIEQLYKDRLIVLARVSIQFQQKLKIFKLSQEQKEKSSYQQQRFPFINIQQNEQELKTLSNQLQNFINKSQVIKENFDTNLNKIKQKIQQNDLDSKDIQQIKAIKKSTFHQKNRTYYLEPDASPIKNLNISVNSQQNFHMISQENTEKFENCFLDFRLDSQKNL